MLRLGVTGGIGSGKTAMTNTLEKFDITVIDADIVAREIVEPGRPAWHALVDAFGKAVIGPDERIDRAFLADVSFPNRSALRRLNAITHGAIGMEIIRQIDALGDASYAVAVPLFRVEHRALFRLEEVWATEVAPEVAVQRLIAYRGFSEADARARIASQMTNDERRAIVDVVVGNEGTLEDFETSIALLLEARGFRRA